MELGMKVLKMVMKDNPRQARGLDILKDETAVMRVGHPKRFEYKVKAQSNPGGYYTVTKQQDLWGCTCPDYKFRKNNCKHIYAVL